LSQLRLQREKWSRDADAMFDKRFVRLYRGYGGPATLLPQSVKNPHPPIKGFYEDAKHLACLYVAAVFRFSFAGLRSLLSANALPSRPATRHSRDGTESGCDGAEADDGAENRADRRRRQHVCLQRTEHRIPATE
jgi:hypothetical protein